MAETLKEKTAKGLFWGRADQQWGDAGYRFGIRHRPGQTVVAKRLWYDRYDYCFFSDSQCLAEFGLHHGYHEYQGTYR